MGLHPKKISGPNSKVTSRNKNDKSRMNSVIFLLLSFYYTNDTIHCSFSFLGAFLEFGRKILEAAETLMTDVKTHTFS